MIDSSMRSPSFLKLINDYMIDDSLQNILIFLYMSNNVFLSQTSQFEKSDEP